MFYNLAFKNVLRSFKDYSVYFLTLTFGVCIFYVFNSLDSQQVLLDFTQQQSTLVYFMLETIAIVSAIISVVLAGLILYANNFILRRRKREFGLYMTLGIQRRRIALMLLVETLVALTCSSPQRLSVPVKPSLPAETQTLMPAAVAAS